MYSLPGSTQGPRCINVDCNLTVDVNVSHKGCKVAGLQRRLALLDVFQPFMIPSRPRIAQLPRVRTPRRNTAQPAGVDAGELASVAWLVYTAACRVLRWEACCSAAPNVHADCRGSASDVGLQPRQRKAPSPLGALHASSAQAWLLPLHAAIHAREVRMQRGRSGRLELRRQSATWSARGRGVRG